MEEEESDDEDTLEHTYQNIQPKSQNKTRIKTNPVGKSNQINEQKRNK